MFRPPTLLWLALILIFLLPSTAGRFLLDLAGGLTIIFLTLPLILAGAGWIGWRWIKSQMVTCEVCGINIFAGSMQCPSCGADLSKSLTDNSVPASSATIDITAKDAD